MRRKPRWTFESKETYKPPGIDHHVSAIKQWEASLPGVKLHGFVADLWIHFRQIGIGLNLIVVFWCHNSGSRNLEGSAVALLELQLVSKVVLAFLGQCVHFWQHHLLVPVQHCQNDYHCVEPYYSVAQAWTFIKHFNYLLGPKLATPGGDKFPLPSQVYRLLGTKVYLTVAPREIRVLPSRVDSICCELKQIPSSKKLSKGHASEIFGKLSFSAGQLFGRFGRMYLVQFKLRQYGKYCCSHLTEEIERAIACWLSVLPCGPLRAVPPRSGTPFVITMSDGEGTGSVAAAIWSPLAPGGVHQPRWFQIDLQPSVLVAWSESTDIEPQRQINKLRPSFLQFVFAPGPSSSAVRSGYTSSTRWCSGLPYLWLLKNSSFSAVVHYTWAQIPALGCRPCFERVPSECNIVDGLSRRNFSTAQANNWVRDSAQLPEPLLT